jgi:hypothetical protein
MGLMPALLSHVCGRREYSDRRRSTLDYNRSLLAQRRFQKASVPIPVCTQERAKLKFIATAEDGGVMGVPLGVFYSTIDFGSDGWSRSSVSSV